MESTTEIIEPRLFAGAVADEIAHTLNDRIQEQGFATIMLAGGSTPAAVYKTLSVPPRVHEVPWGKVRFFWGDERWVAHEDTQSNYRMASTHLLSQIKEEGPQIFPVDTSLETPDLGAAAYEETIRKNVPIGSDGLPVFDLVLLGLGEDGHIASLFPGSSALHHRDPAGSPWCVATKNPHDGSRRITLTAPVLFAASHVMFIVSGQAKTQIVKEVLEGMHNDISTLPALLYKTAKHRLSWFLDTQAAARLKRT